MDGVKQQDSTPQNDSTQIKSKSNQKVLFRVGTFCSNQHKLSRAFQTDMHNKLHKLDTAQ
jgi:hypothetical protein